MAQLVWDQDTKRLFENGVDNGVLYVIGSTGEYGKGDAWDGLTKVSESPKVRKLLQNTQTTRNTLTCVQTNVSKVKSLPSHIHKRGINVKVNFHL